MAPPAKPHLPSKSHGPHPRRALKRSTSRAGKNLRDRPTLHTALRIAAANVPRSLGSARTSSRWAGALSLFSPSPFSSVSAQGNLGPYQKADYVDKYIEGLRSTGWPE